MLQITHFSLDLWENFTYYTLFFGPMREYYKLHTFLWTYERILQITHFSLGLWENITNYTLSLDLWENVTNYTLFFGPMWEYYKLHTSLWTYERILQITHFSLGLWENITNHALFFGPMRECYKLHTSLWTYERMLQITRFSLDLWENITNYTFFLDLRENITNYTLFFGPMREYYKLHNFFGTYERILQITHFSLDLSIFVKAYILYAHIRVHIQHTHKIRVKSMTVMVNRWRQMTPDALRHCDIIHNGEFFHELMAPLTHLVVPSAICPCLND